MFGYIFNNGNFCIINLVSLPIEIIIKNSRYINPKGGMLIKETLISLKSNYLMKGQLNLSFGKRKVLLAEDLVLNVQDLVLNLHPPVLNLRPSVLNLRPSVLNLSPSVLNLRPSVLNLRPSVLNLRPSVLNLCPSVCFKSDLIPLKRNNKLIK